MFSYFLMPLSNQGCLNWLPTWPTEDGWGCNGSKVSWYTASVVYNAWNNIQASVLEHSFYVLWGRLDVSIGFSRQYSVTKCWLGNSIFHSILACGAYKCGDIKNLERLQCIVHKLSVIIYPSCVLLLKVHFQFGSYHLFMRLLGNFPGNVSKKWKHTERISTCYIFPLRWWC